MTFRAAAESLAEEESKRLGSRAKATLDKVEDSVGKLFRREKDAD